MGTLICLSIKFPTPSWSPLFLVVVVVAVTLEATSFIILLPTIKIRNIKIKWQVGDRSITERVRGFPILLAAQSALLRLSTVSYYPPDDSTHQEQEHQCEHNPEHVYEVTTTLLCDPQWWRVSNRVCTETVRGWKK